MKTTVLLVEDNRIQKLTNERILHKAGYTVLHAADGEEALRLARQAIPDLILLDMLLPKLSGRLVMLALKEDPSTALIPVLVFSTLSQANEQKLKHDGASGYFEKSRVVDEDSGEQELIALIEKLLKESRTRKKATAQRVQAAQAGG